MGDAAPASQPSNNQLQLLIAAAQTNGQAINGLNKTLKNVFPQQGTTSTTATAGSATLPSNPVGFLDVVIGGTSFKFPYYNT
jgi:hypothetical protein